MKSSRERVLLFAIAAVPLLLASRGTAQWQALHTFSLRSCNVCFFPKGIPGLEHVGFVFTHNDDIFELIDTMETWRTSDDGKTWELCAFPNPIPDNGPPLYSHKTTVTGVAFRDSLVGWATYNAQNMDLGGCAKTTDGGHTWIATDLINGNCWLTGVFYVPASQKVFLPNWYSPLLVSSDDGSSWQKWGNGNINGIAFSTDFNGVASLGANNANRDYDSISSGSPVLITTDAGNTWHLGIDSSEECWRPLAVPNTTIYFEAGDFSSKVRKSTDGGLTWFTSLYITDSSWHQDNDLSGTMDIDECGGIYVGTGNYGFFLSEDTGKTWIKLPPIPYPSTMPYQYAAHGIGQDITFSVRAGYLYAVARSSVEPQTQCVLWRLDVGSFLRDYYGISPHFDDGTQRTTLHPGDSVGVIFVPGAGTLAATDSVTLTLRYDPNAVSLASLQVPSGWWITDSSTTCTPPPLQEEGAGGWCSLILTLRSDSAESLPDPLLHAEFHTFLSPGERRAGGASLQTFIYLDSAQSFFPHTTPCAPRVLSLQQPDSVELDFTGCGDSLLEASMLHEPPFTIESVVPNPATASLSVRVEGRGQKVEGLEVQLFDALGKCVLGQRPGAETAPLQPYTLHPIPYTLTLDVSNLPSGIYFLRVSSGGYALSRSVAIER